MLCFALAAGHLLQKPPDASDAFFSKGEIPLLKIEVSPEELGKLLADGRKFVRCTVRENNKIIYKDIGIKLKGAAGSYREFSDKPALTLRCLKFGEKKTFHGLEKFHLNNSVQDDTYLNEFIGSEFSRSAGIPTPRVTHARVWLNGRDVGLYVLKEGFDELLISRYYKNAKGSLYDGGFCQDVDAELEKDAGRDEKDRSDLVNLCAAARIADPAARFEELPKYIDIPVFIKFCAVELMLGHWDGYNQSHNNYRLYFDDLSNKAYFLPHGMDQILGDSSASVLDIPGSIVSSAVMKNPKWRAEFRKKLKELLPLFASEKLINKIDEAAARLHTVLSEINADEAKAHAERVKDLKLRIAARAESIKNQNNEPDPKPLAFSGSIPKMIKNWRPASESEDAKLAEIQQNGEHFLAIECGKSASCVASWRANVYLQKGKYKFTAMAKTEGLVPLAGDPPGGVKLRRSGAPAQMQISTSEKLTELSFTFEVTEIADHVELVAEARSSKGKAFFKLESMRLARTDM